MECHVIFMVRWMREKKSGLQVCSQLLAGYNMDSNKSGERMRDEM